jgi:AraC-like DNA-binding protein
MNKHFRVSGHLPHKLEEVGVRVSAVLGRAGLPQNLFAQPRVLVTTEELFALWRAMGEVSGDPAVGLLLGTEAKTEHFSPSALAALSTENLGVAVHQIARYKQLTCPEEILQRVDDGGWSIQFRWTLSTGMEPRVLVDCCFAWMLSIARHGTGTNISPLRLEFAQDRAYRNTMERHFGCPVICGTTRNAIVFRAADAQRPFVTRNAELLSVLAPQLDEELRKQSGEEDFTETVRREIQQQLTGRRPAVEDIARALHVSSRTLQRRLQETGASFQRVLEEARHQLARHYLNNSVLELNEAAYLLGYEDSNSFVRAFRIWEGVPPARWREEQRARVAS